MTAELARNAGELKSKTNVVPRIGKVKYQMHGLESGASTGPDESNQGREQLLGKGHTKNPERAILRARRIKLAETSMVRMKLPGIEEKSLHHRKSHRDAQRKWHTDS